MSIAMLFIILLLIGAVIGFSYVISVHKALTKEFEEKKWMDNSEFDYGHDVRYDYTDY